MTSADFLVAQAITDARSPLTELELEERTGLRPAAIHNGIKNLLRDGRLKVIREKHVYLYAVKS
jgi:hypothetical protein